MNYVSGEKFRILSKGKTHIAGDLRCSGCGAGYPHPHLSTKIIHLHFLVHGEAFRRTIHRKCEGGCTMDPLRPGQTEQAKRKHVEAVPEAPPVCRPGHLDDHDLERFHLGMIQDEAELAPFEEHLLSCAECAERAEATAEYVDAMRSAMILGNFDEIAK